MKPPSLTQALSDLPAPLPEKLRLLRSVAETGCAAAVLEKWTALQPEVVSGPDWMSRAWWGLAAGELVREYLFDRSRRAEAIELIDDFSCGAQIDDARRHGGVILVAAHVGPPKLLMNFLLDRFVPLLVWTNTADMPSWLQGATLARFANPCQPDERAALLVRTSLHLKRGGVVLAAADWPTGARTEARKFGSTEVRMSLGIPALSKRVGVPCFLVMALWRGDRVAITGTRLLDPCASISDEEWNQKWVDCYWQAVHKAMLAGPENIRMLRAVANGSLLSKVGAGGLVRGESA